MPKVEITLFDAEDVITTSDGDVELPGIDI